MGVDRDNRRHTRFWGLILIIIGGFFLFENIGLFDFGDFISTFWPVILICIGLWIIFKSKEQSTSRGKHVHPSQTGDKEVRDSSDRIAMSNIFGDVKTTVHSHSFQGGTISTIFGDIVIDLSQIDIQSGDKDLTLHNVFGDIQIIPPQNVAFSMKGNSVAGDITIRSNTQSGLFPKLDYKSEGFNQAPKRLRIYASHVFGDIKVT